MEWIERLTLLMIVVAVTGGMVGLLLIDTCLKGGR
jgi:hypothetical protein